MNDAKLKTLMLLSVLKFTTKNSENRKFSLSTTLWLFLYLPGVAIVSKLLLSFVAIQLLLQMRTLGTTPSLQPFKYEAQTALFKDPVRTAQ